MRFVFALLLLIPCLSQSMPTVEGFRDGRDCESMLLSSRKWDNETARQDRIQAAAVELLMFMILEHPIQLQVSRPDQKESAKDLITMFHLSMAGTARATEKSKTLGMDFTGFSKLVPNPNERFRHHLDEIDRSRSREYYNRLSHTEKTNLAQSILENLYRLIQVLGMQVDSDLSKTMAGVNASIELSVPPPSALIVDRVKPDKYETKLELKAFNLFDLVQLQRMLVLADYFEEYPIAGYGRPFSFLKPNEKKDESTESWLMARDFIVKHLPEILTARAHIFHDRNRRGGYGNVMGIWGAIQSTESDLRSTLRRQIRELSETKSIAFKPTMPSELEDVYETSGMFDHLLENLKMPKRKDLPDPIENPYEYARVVALMGSINRTNEVSLPVATDEMKTDKVIELLNQELPVDISSVAKARHILKVADSAVEAILPKQTLNKLVERIPDREVLNENLPVVQNYLLETSEKSRKDLEDLVSLRNLIRPHLTLSQSQLLEFLEGLEQDDTSEDYLERLEIEEAHLILANIEQVLHVFDIRYQEQVRWMSVLNNMNAQLRQYIHERAALLAVAEITGESFMEKLKTESSSTALTSGKRTDLNNLGIW